MHQTHPTRIIVHTYVHNGIFQSQDIQFFLEWWGWSHNCFITTRYISIIYLTRFDLFTLQNSHLITSLLYSSCHICIVRLDNIEHD